MELIGTAFGVIWQVGEPLVEGASRSDNCRTLVQPGHEQI
jgi:hypothetical protein